MPTNIEEEGGLRAYFEPTNKLIWKTVEEWYKENHALVEQLTNVALDQEIPPRDVLKKLWLEIQAFYYLFSNSMPDLIKFKQDYRYLVDLLSPFLRDLPSFHTDPRYVKDNEAYREIRELADSLVNADRHVVRLQKLIEETWTPERGATPKLDEKRVEELKDILGPNLANEYIDNNSRVNLVRLSMLADQLNDED